MKTWIKRSIIGLVSATALLGGIGAWAGYQAVHHGWQTMSPEEVAAKKARIVDRIASRMDLDATQKAKLGTLADAVQVQRAALLGSGDLRAELKSLVAGPVFDRNKATALIEAKQTAVTLKSPAVVAALADFYDSLKPEQQARVREFMARHEHRGERRHDKQPSGG
jgi:Spy/CpxP family protein refolding chaperone